MAGCTQSDAPDVQSGKAAGIVCRESIVDFPGPSIELLPAEGLFRKAWERSILRHPISPDIRRPAFNVLC